MYTYSPYRGRVNTLYLQYKIKWDGTPHLRIRIYDSLCKLNVMAIYNNETDPNVKQWEEQQHREMLLTSPSYREWWERNKPKPNEEQQNSDEEISEAE